MQRLTFALLFCFCPLLLLAQHQTEYRVEAFASAATGEHTPFWMVNHSWGVTALEADNFYLRGALSHRQQINSDWSWDAGIDIAGGNASSYGTAWLQQLYGRLNWKILRLDVGMREDYRSLQDACLSSGDFIGSNNARPLPEIRISVPEFQVIPYTKGILAMKGDFAVGRYLDDKWLKDRATPYNRQLTQGVLAHHKSLFFRFGRNAKSRFIFGIQHQVQWGGEIWWSGGNGVYYVHQQPSNIDDFFRAIIAREGSESASGSDKLYVTGSEIGNYIFRYDYQINNDHHLGVYINHFFDDGTGMVFENYPDNLYGLEWSTPQKSLLSKVVVEYIYTKQQTGPMHFDPFGDDRNIPTLKKGGNDNYYNNGDYVQGPSYFGKTMGTPLFLSPEYNTDGRLNFKSNRIIAFHLGAEGYFNDHFQYRLLLSQGRSWGRYYAPFPAVQSGFASQLELLYTCLKQPAWHIRLVAGYDRGAFFGGNTYGAGVSVVYRGEI